MWDEKKVPYWINEICEKAMQSLLLHNFPYKFIVTCMLIQKTEKPLYGCFSMHWENNIDNIEQVVYPSTRAKDTAGKTIQCFATVVGLRF